MIDTIDGSYNGPNGVVIDGFFGFACSGLLVDGFTTKHSSDVVIRNSTFHDQFTNVATQLGAQQQVYGVITEYVDRVLVENCSFFNIDASKGSPDFVGGVNVGYATGLGAFGGNGITVDNCVSYSILGYKAFGFHGASGQSDVAVYNSVAEAIISPIQVMGFQFSGAVNVTMLNCVAQNLQMVNPNAPDNSNVYSAGINLNQTSQCTLVNCHAQNVQSLANGTITGTPNVLAGFYLGGPSAGQYVCDGCTAEKITGPCNFVSGFMLVENPNVVIKNCVASNIENTATVLTTTCIAAGFDTQIYVGTAVLNNGIFENCVAESVTSAIPTQGRGFWIDHAVGVAIRDCVSYNCGYGMQLSGGPSTGALNSIIQGNLVYDNILAGFVDLTPNPMNNLYISNYAYNNNGANYVGVAANTPIRSWAYSTGGFAPTANNNGNASCELVDNWDIS